MGEWENICLLLLSKCPQETTLASHLAKSWQDACAYKILQDGRFGKIEQEHLARSFKTRRGNEKGMITGCKNGSDSLPNKSQLNFRKVNIGNILLIISNISQIKPFQVS